MRAKYKVFIIYKMLHEERKHNSRSELAIYIVMSELGQTRKST